MAFGQQAGPPATGRQVDELLRLLHEAGHADFRDARGPMGFNQRQAGGRFTRDEAETFIGRLHEAETSREDPPPPAPPAPGGPVARRSPPLSALSAVSAPQLAAELRRRGWTVTAP